mmetsp:Transcript_28016/g.93087  ORF Transcript_28016/g.93087 Transcript_28016/m.93087 type:complete len:88 (-) Transcript_28016:1244-1507(-)
MRPGGQDGGEATLGVGGKQKRKGTRADPAVAVGTSSLPAALVQQAPHKMLRPSDTNTGARHQTGAPRHGVQCVSRSKSAACLEKAMR